MKKIVRANTSIKDLCDRIAQGLIIIRPYWQREVVWTNITQSLLIDSILCDYLIYPLVLVPDDGDNDILLMVDGQQRLSTIDNFKKGGLVLSGLSPTAYKGGKLEDLNGRKYQDLSLELQRKFDMAQVGYEILYDFAPGDIEKIYCRLQRGVPLTPAEKRNALITKEVPRVVRELAQHPFLAKCGLRNSRGQHWNFSARTLLHEQRQSKKVRHINFTSMANQALDSFFKDDIDLTKITPTVVSIYEKLVELDWQTCPLVSEIEAIVVYIAASHLWQNYTLTNTQFFKAYQAFRAKQSEIDIDQLPLLMKNNGQNTSGSFLQRLFNGVRNHVVDLDALEHATWKYYYIKGLSGAVLEEKVEILVRYILYLNADVLPLDNQREFRSYQRAVLFYNSKGQCTLCKKSLSPNETWHADHILPYSKGGKTQISNGQVLCPECNTKKSNKG